MKRRRPVQALSLSFLDVMSVGLGSVILLFLIIQHATEVRSAQALEADAEQLAALEARLLERQQTADALAFALNQAEAELSGARARLEEAREQLARPIPPDATLAVARAQVQALQAEVQALERRVAELRASEREARASLRRLDDGDRQYLTGLKVGGRHVLILIDASASMLAPTIVESIRLRNMDPARQRESAKWQQTLASLEWIAANLPADARFQIYLFNDRTRAAIEGTMGRWLEIAGEPGLAEAVAASRSLLPFSGTNLHSAMVAARELSPRPDRIFLVTDGLPTQNLNATRRGTVSSGQRQELFRTAVLAMPQSVPVNVLLLPMEGDPMAASLFWQLAQLSGGTLITPAADWP